MWLEKLSRVILIIVLPAIFFPIAAAYAEGSIQIKSAKLAAVEDGYQLSVDSEIVLNPTLEEALEKGIVLYFVTKFLLVDSRWYWVDKEVARSKLRVGLRYYALTRQYRLSHESFSQSFYTLKEALRALGHFDRPVVIKSVLEQDVDYIATLRVWLDLTRLPKPFQVETLGSQEWSLSSDNLEWRMKLPLLKQPLHIRGDL
tara:strand:+ start:353 stop:955 length:603 start_codon:yes stop_codon:yes gene_type:complete